MSPPWADDEGGDAGTYYRREIEQCLKKQVEIQAERDDLHRRNEQLQAEVLDLRERVQQLEEEREDERRQESGDHR